MKKCPDCKFLTSDLANTCGCGYEFGSVFKSGSDRRSERARRLKRFVLLLSPIFVFLCVAWFETRIHDASLSKVHNEVLGETMMEGFDALNDAIEAGDLSQVEIGLTRATIEGRSKLVERRAQWRQDHRFLVLMNRFHLIAILACIVSALLVYRFSRSMSGRDRKEQTGKS